MNVLALIGLSDPALPVFFFISATVLASVGAVLGIVYRHR